jgi:hypothetical protein
MDMRTLLEMYDRIHALATDIAELAETSAQATPDKHLLALLHSHANRRLQHMSEDLSLLKAALK